VALVTSTERHCDGTKNCDAHPFVNAEHATPAERPHQHKENDQ
jgi:hypothetical protein